MATFSPEPTAQQAYAFKGLSRHIPIRNFFGIPRPLNCRQRALGVAKWRNHVHKQMGPRRTHTLADEPFNYWASVVSHVVVTLVLSALAAGAFWLAHLERLGNKASKQPSVKP